MKTIMLVILAGIGLATAAHALHVESILLDPRYSNTAAESIAFITNRMEADGVESASLALVDSNQIVWLGCFGDEDRGRGIVVSTNTVFRIGSCSKVFTTVAALQLWDQGVLSLTTTVRECLPGFSLLARTNYPSSDTITVQQLLNHHSGIPGDLYRHGDLVVPFGGFPSMLLSYLATTYPPYPPGLVNSYCNTAFTIAGRIVEQRNTSGVSFVSYCNQNIFVPLGMHSSSYMWNSPGITNHLAVVYDGSTALPAEYVNAEGSGSMYSTPSDMAQFLKAILAGGMGPQGRLLSPGSLAAMLTPQGTNLPLNIDNWWIAGLGWDSVVNPRLDYAGRVCFKTGVTALFSAYMEALHDQQLAAAFIHTTSSSSLSVDGTDYLLRQAVRDKSGIPIPLDVEPVGAPIIAAPQALLDGAEGMYVDTTVSIIAATNGTLTWLRNVATVPIAVTGLVLRTNGWFSTPASQDIELRFTNLAGRSVMVRRDIQPDRSLIRQTLGGERVVPPPYSVAWTNRLNRPWPLLDEHADLFACVAGIPPLCMTVRPVGNCLVMDAFLAGSGHLLLPDTDTRAFVPGMVTRLDGAVQYYSTNGVAVAQFAGSYYQDPDTIPLIAVGATNNGAVVLDYASALYAIDLASNGTCEALVTAAPSSFQLAVLDDGFSQLAVTNAGAVLPVAAPHAGRHYLKVMAPTSGQSTGSFVLLLKAPEPAAPLDVSASLAAIVTNRTVPGLMGMRFDGSTLTASGVAGLRVRGQATNMLQATDVMHFGSMFKVQTATLGGILVDTNAITWGAFLLDYVTLSQKTVFIATDARWTNVTLRQLLSMSSGIEDEVVPCDPYVMYSWNTNPVAGRQYLLDMLSHSTLSANPGTAYYYSNYGYTMAGMMLEVAWNQFSGMSNTYEQLMEQKLFAPLGINTATRGVPGMNSTVPTNVPAADPSPVAIGHNARTNDPAEGLLLGDPVGLGYVDAENPLMIIPAGVWAMRMADYAKLLQVQMQTNQTALLDSIGLTIQTLVAIRTPVIVTTLSNIYSFSLGWVVDTTTSNRLFYTGSNNRWLSMVNVRLDSQIAVVAACNQGATDVAVQEALDSLEAVPEPSVAILAMVLGVGAQAHRWRTRQ